MPRIGKPKRGASIGPGDDPSPAAIRLLRALAAPGASVRPDPIEDGAMLVTSRSDGVSLGRGRHAAATVAELARRDLVAESGERTWIASDAGLAAMKRLAAPAESRFADQHRDLDRRAFSGDNGHEALPVNLAESPLEWLRRRRDRDGAPLIDAAAFEAGERLRRDLTAAGMMPSVTARWDGAVGGGRRDPAAATDAVVAARQRIRRTMEAVGGDFADLLIDLCGFLKGLETIERERSWPPRSGKVVVRLALGALARHYGLAPEARGPARSRGIRIWEAASA